MSYTVSITIRCDAYPCVKSIIFGAEQKGGLSKTFAGLLAKNRGWYIPGYPGSYDPKRALCPDHAPTPE